MITREHFFSALQYYPLAGKRWKTAIELLVLHRHHFDDPGMIEYKAILSVDDGKLMRNPVHTRKVKMKHVQMLRNHLSMWAKKVKKFPNGDEVLERLGV